HSAHTVTRVIVGCSHSTWQRFLKRRMAYARGSLQVLGAPRPSAKIVASVGEFENGVNNPRDCSRRSILRRISPLISSSCHESYERYRDTWCVSRICRP